MSLVSICCCCCGCFLKKSTDKWYCCSVNTANVFWVICGQWAAQFRTECDCNRVVSNEWASIEVSFSKRNCAPWQRHKSCFHSHSLISFIICCFSWKAQLYLNHSPPYWPAVVLIQHVTFLFSQRPFVRCVLSPDTITKQFYHMPDHTGLRKCQNERDVSITI